MLLPDFSEWQPNVNMAGVRKQTPALILRVGYGHDHKDLQIDRYRPQAVQNGFGWTGLYQYARADQDITAQAEMFCSWVGRLTVGEIPILDLEEGSGDQTARANAWFNVVDDHFALTPLPVNERSWLYSGANFATNNLESIFNSDRHTWVASYGATEPANPHTLWQSTNGAVGVNRVSWAGAGYCDTSTTRYTIDQLAATGWHPSKIQPPPPTSLTWAMWPSTVTLKLGMKGTDVAVCQTALRNSGLIGVRGIAVDNAFGLQTQTAVRNFQEIKGLTIDGIAGPQTRRALMALGPL